MKCTFRWGVSGSSLCTQTLAGVWSDRVNHVDSNSAKIHVSSAEKNFLPWHYQLIRDDYRSAVCAINKGAHSSLQTACDPFQPAWQRVWPFAATQRMARAGCLQRGKFVSIPVLCKHWHTPVNLAILVPNTPDATQGLTLWRINVRRKKKSSHTPWSSCLATSLCNKNQTWMCLVQTKPEDRHRIACVVIFSLAPEMSEMCCKQYYKLDWKETE